MLVQCDLQRFLNTFLSTCSKMCCNCSVTRPQEEVPSHLDIIDKCLVVIADYVGEEIFEKALIVKVEELELDWPMVKELKQFL